MSFDRTSRLATMRSSRDEEQHRQDDAAPTAGPSTSYRSLGSRIPSTSRLPPNPSFLASQTRPQPSTTSGMNANPNNFTSSYSRNIGSSTSRPRPTPALPGRARKTAIPPRNASPILLSDDSTDVEVIEPSPRRRRASSDNTRSSSDTSIIDLTTEAGSSKAAHKTAARPRTLQEQDNLVRAKMANKPSHRRLQAEKRAHENVQMAERKKKEQRRLRMRHSKRIVLEDAGVEREGSLRAT